MEKLEKDKDKLKKTSRPGAETSALGADRCLRFGQAGHRAKNCPVAGAKRKAETNLESDINMVMDEIQLAVEDATGSSDDVAMMDCGAGSVLTSETQLKKYPTYQKSWRWQKTPFLTMKIILQRRSG